MDCGAQGQRGCFSSTGSQGGQRLTKLGGRTWVRAGGVCWTISSWSVVQMPRVSSSSTAGHSSPSSSLTDDLDGPAAARVFRPEARTGRRREEATARRAAERRASADAMGGREVEVRERERDRERGEGGGGRGGVEMGGLSLPQRRFWAAGLRAGSTFLGAVARSLSLSRWV